MFGYIFDLLSRFGTGNYLCHSLFYFFPKKANAVQTDVELTIAKTQLNI